MAKKAVETTIDEEIIETPEVVEAVAETAEETAPETNEPEAFAKSGKRSKKVTEEVAAEEARQARKVEKKAAEEAGEESKGPRPVARTRLERRGKNYREAAKKVEAGKSYTLANAIKLALETTTTKFDSSIEIHARLDVDPRQADQNIRTTVVLPNGSGKTVRVAVFAPEAELAKAKAAGADITGDEEFTKALDKGELNFDILISTPAYMQKLGKYARVLGPKGLMPNPKAGTVTNDIEKAVKEAKTGKIEYRVDKQAIVHIGIGKASFGADKLIENAEAFMTSLRAQKPASVKGTYIKSLFVTTTMGPSIAVENSGN